MAEKTKIHSTAIIDKTVELGNGVEIGPYTVLKGHVKVGDGTTIHERVTVEGYTTIGQNNEIFSGAILGTRSQDKKFTGGKNYLYIGDNNTIREYVTMNPSTDDGGETQIGNDNLFMAYSHIAHDCVVGSSVVFANVATLAGHVTVEDGVIIGGLSAVHQFTRIGKIAIIGGCSKVVQDIPPFMMVDGHPVKAHGINSVGLERNGVSSEERAAIKKAYKILFRSQSTLKNAITEIESSLGEYPKIQDLLAFLRESSRGICK